MYKSELAYRQPYLSLQVVHDITDTRVLIKPTSHVITILQYLQTDINSLTCLY